MWTGYSNENDAEIIILLRENKKPKKEKKNKVTGLALVLKAVHATFLPELH